MRSEEVGRLVAFIHSQIIDLERRIAYIGEHDAREIDAARFKLEQLSQKLRFTTLQAAE